MRYSRSVLRATVASAASFALTAGVIVGVTAPVQATDLSSDTASTAPAGKALVRLESGQANVVKKSKNTYRIVLPNEAKATWFGEQRNGKVGAGKFGHRGLVEGWKALGNGPSVQATMTWVAKDKSGKVYAPASVSAPRLDAKGRLNFTATTAATVPAAPQQLTINIARARKQVRDFPIEFDSIGISSTLTVNLVATAADNAYFGFNYNSNGTWGFCPDVSNISLEGGDYKKKFSNQTCDGVVFLDSGSLVAKIDQDAGWGSSTVTGSIVVQAVGGGKTFTYDWWLGEWTSGGELVSNASGTVTQS